MTYYYIQFLALFPKNLGCTLGYKVMTGAVETVSSNLVLLVVLIRNAVHIGLVGHGLMEGCIEYGYHGNARHNLLAGIDSDDVGRIVKRRKVVTLCNCCHNLVVDYNRGCELLTAVNYSVTYGINLVKGLDYADICIC